MGDKVELTCLCGKNKESVQLLSKIPIEVTICHCNSCRYNKGTLYYSSLPVTAPPICVSNLKHYQFSSNIERYFCPTCGTHICYNLKDQDSWHLSSGVVDRIIDNEQVSGKLEKIVEHQFVSDTKDGGLAVCFDKSVQSQVDKGTESGQFSSKQSKLRAACHCGGVDFLIERPNEKSITCSRPFPDMINPYTTESSDNPTDEKWWITDAGKYVAGTCACRSCRLAFASPITCWAFIPKPNMLNKDGSQFEFGTGTLQTYESSKDTYRDFCKICGSSIFWHDAEHPYLIDVSVGIMRAEEGSRAESWLEWATNRVSFSEDAFDKDLIGALEVGLHSLEKK